MKNKNLTCCIGECQNPAKAKGMCGKHYMRKWTHGDVTVDNRATGRKRCEIDFCKNESIAYGMCGMHYQRVYRHGDTTTKINYGSYRHIHEQGYVMIWTGSKYVLEHVLVAEKALDKPLPPKAVVHHVNGIKSDNRPENLVICPDQGYHIELHWRQRKRDAEEAGQAFLESISR